MGWIYLSNQHFNGITVEVWEWISNFIPYFMMDVITYPCWDLSKTMSVKGTPKFHNVVWSKATYSKSLRGIETKKKPFGASLQWRHNGRVSASNHRRLDCSFNHLCRHRSKKTSKLRVAGLYEGHSPVTGEFPSQRASNAKNVSIWWRYHG